MDININNLNDLKSKSLPNLVEYAKELEVENASDLKKQDLMFAILKKLAEKNNRFNLLLEIAKKQKRLHENRGYAEISVEEIKAIFEEKPCWYNSTAFFIGAILEPPKINIVSDFSGSSFIFK